MCDCMLAKYTLQTDVVLSLGMGEKYKALFVGR